MVNISKSKHKYILSVLWLIVIIMLSLMPDNGQLSETWFTIKHLDKLAHLIMYAVLSFLFMRDGMSLKLILTLCLTVGIGIEIIQGKYLDGRHFELLDIIANIIGYSVGIGLYNLCKSKWHD